MSHCTSFRLDQRSQDWMSCPREPGENGLCRVHDTRVGGRTFVWDASDEPEWTRRVFDVLEVIAWNFGVEHLQDVCATVGGLGSTALMVAGGPLYLREDDDTIDIGFVWNVLERRRSGGLARIPAPGRRLTHLEFSVPEHIQFVVQPHHPWSLR